MWLAGSRHNEYIHLFLTERIYSFLKQKEEILAEQDLERSIESLLAGDSDDVSGDTFEESFSDQGDVAKE